MRALMLIAALVTAAYAQAETPTRLYRTGYDDVEAKHYVALFRYEGECQTAAKLWNAHQNDLRFWCERDK